MTEFVQATRPTAPITTLHDFGDRPVSKRDLPLNETAVVLPMTAADAGREVTASILETLGRVDPGTVVVPVRADADRIGDVTSWLDGFEASVTVLWCGAPVVSTALEDAGITAPAGKGRDVWLGVGVACTRAEYVVVHDADIGSYNRDHVPRLLWPLTRSASFSKGYYARIEDGRLYGRLFRLFYRPLVAALRADARDRAGRVPALLSFLDTFRYALAGDVGFHRRVVRRCRFEPGLGLEVGILAEVFDVAGSGAVAQVDLGRYTHDHRPIDGSEGLTAAAAEVGSALLRVLEDRGMAPAHESLPRRYRERAHSLLASYAEDAAFNGLTYDREAEARQIERYAEAIESPGPDYRLPPWSEIDLSPERVLDAATPTIE